MELMACVQPTTKNQISTVVLENTTRKVSKNEVFLVRIVPYLDWIRTRKIPYLNNFYVVKLQKTHCKMFQRKTYFT